MSRAKAAGQTKFILFLHYPPTNILESSSPFTKMAKAYGAEQVVYAHCHGQERFNDSLLGKKREHSVQPGLRGLSALAAAENPVRKKPMRIALNTDADGRGQRPNLDTSLEISGMQSGQGQI